MVGEITTPCVCTIRRDQLDNVRRAWRPAITVPTLKDGTPLMEYTRQNLWLRANLPTLKSHIRTLGMNSHPRWMFRVITDVDLMTSWLYSANEVFDGDVGAARLRGENTATRITDLVEPWELLIFRLGVKAARNNATPEVLLEALFHREQMGLPTWVVDNPKMPFVGETHRAWSVEVAEFMSGWVFLDLESCGLPVAQTPRTPIQGKRRSPVALGVSSGAFQEMGLPPAPKPQPVPKMEPVYEDEEPEAEEDDFNRMVNTETSDDDDNGSFFDRMVTSDPDGTKKKGWRNRR
jgi:uncharacterized protein YndB with AHSA1/START domain